MTDDATVDAWGFPPEDDPRMKSIARWLHNQHCTSSPPCGIPTKDEIMAAVVSTALKESCESIGGAFCALCGACSICDPDGSTPGYCYDSEDHKHRWNRPAVPVGYPPKAPK